MCDCDPCLRVAAHLERPRMAATPPVEDRVTHLKHLVRDNPVRERKASHD